MPNQFYVKPAGENIGGQLVGLGHVIAQTREAQEEKRKEDAKKLELVNGQRELQAAYESDDPDKVAKVIVKNPLIAQQAKEALGIMNSRHEKDFAATAMSILSDPDNAVSTITTHAQDLIKKGQDPKIYADLAQEFAQAEGNPAARQKALRKVEIGLAMGSKSGYDAWKEQNEPKITSVNPEYDAYSNGVLAKAGTPKIEKPKEREVRADANGVPRFVDNGQPAFPDAPKAAKEREVKNDANGVPRYVDDASPVFKDVAKTPAPPTADQSKAALFAQRASDSHPIIEKFAPEFSKIKSAVGKAVPEILKTQDRKLFDQASRDFINAVLRRESGAAISPSEFDSANLQYLPQPGDKEAVLAQKKKNRETVAAGLKAEAASALGALQKNLPAQSGRFTIEEVK